MAKNDNNRSQSEDRSEQTHKEEMVEREGMREPAEPKAEHRFEGKNERAERARSMYEERERESGKEQYIERRSHKGENHDKRKNAIVTGGSSGIGKAFAERLAKENYKVYIFSHDSDYYKKLIAYWQDQENLIPIVGDITDPRAVDNLVDEITRQDNHLDLLINNAAILDNDDGPFPPLEVFKKTLDVDLMGQYLLINKTLPLLRRADKPIIINISSGSGSLLMVRTSGPLAYRVSKAGLNMLTKSMSYDLAAMNIAIHAVDPGFVDTKLSPGGITPEESVSGMWHLVTLHDLDKSGQYWYHKDVIRC